MPRSQQRFNARLDSGDTIWATEYERATGAPLHVTDADGVEHAWRDEIAAKLIALQQEDGSWQNPVDRWMEKMKVLATSYALQTLAFAQDRLP